MMTGSTNHPNEKILTPASDAAHVTTTLRATLDAQRMDFLQQGAVSAKVRIDRLDRGIDVLLKYQDKLVDALNTDFSCRSRQVTLEPGGKSPVIISRSAKSPKRHVPHYAG